MKARTEYRSLGCVLLQAVKSGASDARKWASSGEAVSAPQPPSEEASTVRRMSKLVYEQTPETVAATETAKALHAHILAIHLSEIPVMTADRQCGRKETARLLRALLSRLKIKGVSVTAPNYSMAQAVDICLPKRRDIEFEYAPRRKNPEAAANKANHLAAEKFRALLAVAFPHHDDRSDSQSDHFDYKWSIR